MGKKLIIIAVILLTFCLTLGAQTWSAVGSSGSVADEDLHEFGIQGDALYFNGDGTGLYAVYNVANICGVNVHSNWSFLGLTFKCTTEDTFAAATLKRVNLSTGESEQLAYVTNREPVHFPEGDNWFQAAKSFNHQFNFQIYAYYIIVEMLRVDPAEYVGVKAVSLF